jgi:hypothetical protein
MTPLDLDAFGKKFSATGLPGCVCAELFHKYGKPLGMSQEAFLRCLGVLKMDVTAGSFQEKF